MSESVMSKGAGLRIAVVGVSSLIGEAVIDELRARKCRLPNYMRWMTNAMSVGP